eukprot:5897409-Prymnesium_polylepis.1
MAAILVNGTDREIAREDARKDAGANRYDRHIVFVAQCDHLFLATPPGCVIPTLLVLSQKVGCIHRAWEGACPRCDDPSSASSSNMHAKKIGNGKQC